VLSDTLRYINITEVALGLVAWRGTMQADLHGKIGLWSIPALSMKRRSKLLEFAIDFSMYFQGLPSSLK
jgi:hypothetical protein